LLDFYRERMAAVPADSGRTPFPQDDPVLIRVSLRGFDALLEEVPAAEQGLRPGDDMTVTAYAADGQMLATGTIIPMLSGGYRLDSYSVTGWVDDDPSCLADSRPE
jgi:hypothetical protein